MVGTTQGIIVAPVSSNGSMALAALKPLVLGSNPLSFYQEKPWSIPKLEGDTPGVAAAKALAGIAQAGYKAVKDKQAEARQDRKDIAALGHQKGRDELEEKKFEELVRHNKATESAAIARINKTTPEETSDLDEFESESGVSLRAKRRSGFSSSSDLEDFGDDGVDDDTSKEMRLSLMDTQAIQDPNEEEPSSLFSEPKLTIDGTGGKGLPLAGTNTPSVKFAVADPRMHRDAKPNPDLALKDAPKADTQVKQMNDLPSGNQGGDIGLIVPPKAADNFLTAQGLANMPAPIPVPLSAGQADWLLNGDPLKRQKGVAPIPLPVPVAAGAAPVAEAIANAQQSPALAGMPSVGSSNITGQQAPLRGSTVPPTRIRPNQLGKAVGMFESGMFPGFQYKGFKADPSNKGMIMLDVVPVDKEKAQEHQIRLEEFQRGKQASIDQKKANIIAREGKDLNAHLPVKNYQAANGLQQGAMKFMEEYINSSANNPNQGAADMGLIDQYVISMTNRGVTHQQFEGVLNARSVKDKWQALFNQKLDGSVLSQSQRDGMARTLIGAHNKAASLANMSMREVRERMMSEGITDEKYLPHEFVSDLMLKSDAIRLMRQLDTETRTIITGDYKQAVAKGDKQKAERLKALIDQKTKQVKDLASRLEKEQDSGSIILGHHDFETKRQGFVPGSGGIIDFSATTPKEASQLFISERKD